MPSTLLSNTRSVPILWRRSQVARTTCLNRDMEAVTQRLLVQGGDTRIELNAAGVNAYGFGPRPDLALMQFGSSTGSVISESGFQTAVALVRRLHGDAGSYQAEVERQRRELLLLSGAGALPGTELVFAASGTDVHLVAAHLAERGQADALQAVMVEHGETGSGVPQALQALHFSAETSQGHLVARGTPLPGVRRQPPLCVKLRHQDGSLRSATEVDAEFAACVALVIQAGKRCLLVLTDMSKTGLIAPSLDCARQLACRFGDQLTVLVDACQFRVSQDTLCGYLKHDFMVAVTGSKFFGGPAFCGALLLPPAAAKYGRKVPLDSLMAYSSRFDWPVGWDPAGALAASNNLGLLLRWEAALTELRSFARLPAQVVHAFLLSWQQAVERRFAADGGFAVLPCAPLRRTADDGKQAWDRVQTIFTFQLLKSNPDGTRRTLNPAETALIYQQLRAPNGADNAAEVPFALGQPVHFGLHCGAPVSALRLCSSARLVAESLGRKHAVGDVIAQTMCALDRATELAQALR